MPGSRGRRKARPLPAGGGRVTLALWASGGNLVGSSNGSSNAMSNGSEEAHRLTVIQAKFAAWLSWSQPFIHSLVAGLDEHVRNVVLCTRTENLDRFPAREIARIPTRYLVQPRLAVHSASYLRRNYAPDLMHAHFGWSGLRLLVLKEMLRIPLVVSFGGRDLGMQMHLDEFTPLYSALFDASDHVICVSHDLARRAREAGIPEERISVVHRGTDLRRFAFVDRHERDPDGPVHLLMVGRLTPKKGHEDAFQALARLASEGIDARLEIVGEGDERGRLGRLARELGVADRVAFAGATDHQGVRERMAAADLLLHCSVTTSAGDVEGIPNVVVEAQATGLPVVGTLHGGIPEAVRDGRTGLLVPERDVDALTATLGALATDPKRRLALGEAARDFVTEHFDLRRQVERHLEIYRGVVAAAASDPTWVGRRWIPAGHAQHAQVLRGRSSHPGEFSMSELVEEFWLEVIGRDPFADQAPELQRKASLFERIYELRKLVPEWIRWPFKRIVNPVFAAILGVTLRYRHGTRMEELDQYWIDHLRQGGALPGEVQDEA